MICSYSILDLDNPFEVVEYHLLMKGMSGLGHKDKVSIVNALMRIVTNY